MVTTRLREGFTYLLGQASQSFRIRYFTGSTGSVWDDDMIYSQSGSDLWVSGIIMPLGGVNGATESELLQQGKLLNSDKKIYVNGSVSFNGSLYQIDIMVGSPGDLYSTILDGGHGWTVSANPIYTRQYIRRLTGSSL